MGEGMQREGLELGGEAMFAQDRASQGNKSAQYAQDSKGMKTFFQENVIFILTIISIIVMIIILIQSLDYHGLHHPHQQKSYQL